MGVVQGNLKAFNTLIYNDFLEVCPAKNEAVFCPIRRLNRAPNRVFKKVPLHQHFFKKFAV